jgi:hypothetical protein
MRGWRWTALCQFLLGMTENVWGIHENLREICGKCDENLLNADY